MNTTEAVKKWMTTGNTWGEVQAALEAVTTMVESVARVDSYFGNIVNISY